MVEAEQNPVDEPEEVQEHPREVSGRRRSFARVVDNKGIPGESVAECKYWTRQTSRAASRTRDDLCSDGIYSV